ncbi:WecB/TagA/CpsF family glycosyltransferase [Microcoleus sp. FACHB-1515]|uniref:WecB/TagA/CpsF family glycosyltransferase n=1 Tax=Cyanophyceae TaxID=3028117 RepID=UPI0016833BA7|nr:WecB/TagA/CpsF family glycosyltransferase [Microcoleus sp. FACHB-1515]MBD2090856.1 WecB/TagA/CpsF family glycosyltransferase [Microcoleus sp. FACHB-1515]
MEVSRSQANAESSQATVLGSPIHLLNDYPQWLLDRVHHQGVHVVTLNAEMAMQAEQNSALAQVIDRAELVIPDGSGVVLYLWMRGHKVQRCPGIELAETVLRRLPADATVFFYGGAPGVTEQAAIEWQRRDPNLTIAGTAHGFLSSEEQAQLLNQLRTLQPSVILVGLGVPRQELWIAEHRSICPKAIWIGVGGSFDIWAGTKDRAPGWLRDNHLEWTYRLYQEPWRWRRMLALPKFAWKSIVSLRSLP